MVAVIDIVLLPFSFYCFFLNEAVQTQQCVGLNYTIRWTVDGK
jgi:hypothetical protein